MFAIFLAFINFNFFRTKFKTVPPNLQLIGGPCLSNMSQALIDSNDFSNALFFESAVRPRSPFTLYPHLHVWSWQQILFKSFEIIEFMKNLKKFVVFWKVVKTKYECLDFTIFSSIKTVKRLDFTILISIKHARPALQCTALLVIFQGSWLERISNKSLKPK